MKVFKQGILFMPLIFFPTLTEAQSVIEDVSFGSGGVHQWPIGSVSGHNNQAQQILVQPDGKIVFGGFTESSGNFYFTVGRLNENGTPDNTFNSDGYIMHQSGTTDDCFLYNLALQDDAKILSCGVKVIGSSSAEMMIARYNADGSMDNSFATNGIFLFNSGSDFEIITDIEVLPSGKILATGIVMNLTTDADIIVIRLNEDGTLDNTFSGSGYVILDQNPDSEHAMHMALQDDGKIILGGYIEDAITYDWDLLLMRLDADGNLDNTFGNSGMTVLSVGDSDTRINDLELQSDGKIVVAAEAYVDVSGGSFLHFGTVRFLADGTLDNSFSTDGIALTAFAVAPAEQYNYSLFVDNDNKIVTGGVYANASGDLYIALTRYFEDGTVDTGFDGDGFFTARYGDFNQWIYTMTQQPDGKFVVLGGIANNVGGDDFLFVRYNLVDDAGLNSFTFDEEVKVYPNPTSGNVNLSVSPEFGLVKIEIKNSAGMTLLTTEEILSSSGEHVLNMSSYPDGIYFIDLIGKNERITKRVVKTN